MQETPLSKLLEQLLALPKESEWLEFKHNNADPKEIGEYISALANSAVIHRQERAYLIWGIADDTKKVIGTAFNPDVAKQGNQALEMWLSQKLRPSPHFEFIIGEHCKQRIVLLSIRPVKEEPVKFDRIAYIRVGSHKTKLDDQPGKLKEFWTQAIAGDNGTWDQTKEENATHLDLDEKALKQFISRINKCGRLAIPENEDIFSTLDKLGLTSNGKPTRAAILLIGKEPQRFYPTAFIKAGRFKSPTLIVDDKEFGGTLFQQLDDIMAWFRNRLETKLLIGSGKLPVVHPPSSSMLERQEVWEYPLDALREAIANSICHRSYKSLATTAVRLYDDHLEIWNPGNLPLQLHPEDLMHVHNSYPPNKLIAGAFFNVGIIERWGTGTLRIVEALQQQGLPPPEFNVSSPDTFKLVIHAGASRPDQRAAGVPLNERQLGAIEYLKSNTAITTAEYQELFGASKATSKRDLADLVNQRFVVQTGSGKGTAYRLARS